MMLGLTIFVVTVLVGTVIVVAIDAVRAYNKLDEEEFKMVYFKNKWYKDMGAVQLDHTKKYKVFTYPNKIVIVEVSK